MGLKPLATCSVIIQENRARPRLCTLKDCCISSPCKASSSDHTATLLLQKVCYQAQLRAAPSQQWPSKASLISPRSADFVKFNFQVTWAKKLRDGTSLGCCAKTRCVSQVLNLPICSWHLGYHPKVFLPSGLGTKGENPHIKVGRFSVRPPYKNTAAYSHPTCPLLLQGLLGTKDLQNFWDIWSQLTGHLSSGYCF